MSTITIAIEYVPCAGGGSYALGSWKTRRGALNAVKKCLLQNPNYDHSYLRLQVWGPGPDGRITNKIEDEPIYPIDLV